MQSSTNHQHSPNLINPNNSTIKKYPKKKKSNQHAYTKNFSSKTYHIQHSHRANSNKMTMLIINFSNTKPKKKKKLTN